MMKIGYNIPLDLIFEILLRLPGKSVLRFKSVSKSWLSIISSQQFTKAFMSLSLSRPRLLLASNGSDEGRMLFFSAPHQSSSFLSSPSVLLVTEKNTTLTMPKPKSDYHYICNSVRGFICCCIGDEFVVCNPTTGQVIPLPSKKYNDDDYYCMYLGYDPKSDQYKVLRLIEKSRQFSSRIEHSVCTLGGKGSSHLWRPIKTRIKYYCCYQNGVCIDGVVYYEYENHHNTVLSSFDVGSEKVRLISTPKDLSGTITNYLGKLAVFCSLDCEGEFRIWVLDDVKNQFWSKKTFVVPSFTKISISMYWRFVGITGAGEILYGISSLSYPFEFLYYDVEKKMERIFTVKGLEDYIYDVDNCTILKISPYRSSLLCSYVENIIYL